MFGYVKKNLRVFVIDTVLPTLYFMNILIGKIRLSNVSKRERFETVE